VGGHEDSAGNLPDTQPMVAIGAKAAGTDRSANRTRRQPARGIACKSGTAPWALRSGASPCRGHARHRRVRDNPVAAAALGRAVNRLSWGTGAGGRGDAQFVNLIWAAFIHNSGRRQERVCGAQKLEPEIEVVATSPGSRPQVPAFESAKMPANCGLFGRDEERPVGIGLRGGPEDCLKQVDSTACIG
jgi:hypothetical protein